ncbi:MAG: hypothetical protein U1C66_00055 [Patescibacteria group bacterium]|nr:hypothetical protein [Patescibacteria group bacterium]
MKINMDDQAKVGAAIGEVAANRRGGGDIQHAFTYHQLRSLLEDCERELEGLPLRDRQGIRYECAANARKCNAYKYAYEAVEYKFFRSRQGWYLVGCGRREFFPNQSSRSKIFVTAEQLAIMQRALASRFNIIAEEGR